MAPPPTITSRVEIFARRGHLNGVVMSPPSRTLAGHGGTGDRWPGDTDQQADGQRHQGKVPEKVKSTVDANGGERGYSAGPQQFWLRRRPSTPERDNDSGQDEEQ